MTSLMVSTGYAWLECSRGSGYPIISSPPSLIFGFKVWFIAQITEILLSLFPAYFSFIRIHSQRVFRWLELKVFLIRRGIIGFQSCEFLQSILNWILFFTLTMTHHNNKLFCQFRGTVSSIRNLMDHFWLSAWRGDYIHSPVSFLLLDRNEILAFNRIISDLVVVDPDNAFRVNDFLLNN